MKNKFTLIFFIALTYLYCYPRFSETPLPEELLYIYSAISLKDYHLLSIDRVIENFGEVQGFDRHVTFISRKTDNALKNMNKQIPQEQTIGALSPGLPLLISASLYLLPIKNDSDVQIHLKNIYQKVRLVFSLGVSLCFLLLLSVFFSEITSHTIIQNGLLASFAFGSYFTPQSFMINPAQWAIFSLGFALMFIFRGIHKFEPKTIPVSEIKVIRNYVFHIVIGGFFSGLSVMFYQPSIIVLPVMIVWILFASFEKKDILYYLFAVSFPLAVVAVYNFRIFDSFFPWQYFFDISPWYHFAWTKKYFVLLSKNAMPILFTTPLLIFSVIGGVILFLKVPSMSDKDDEQTDEKDPGLEKEYHEHILKQKNYRQQHSRALAVATIVSWLLFLFFIPKQTSYIGQPYLVSHSVFLPFFFFIAGCTLHRIFAWAPNVWWLIISSTVLWSITMTGIPAMIFPYVYHVFKYPLIEMIFPLFRDGYTPLVWAAKLGIGAKLSILPILLLIGIIYFYLFLSRKETSTDKQEKEIETRISFHLWLRRFLWLAGVLSIVFVFCFISASSDREQRKTLHTIAYIWSQNVQTSAMKKEKMLAEQRWKIAQTSQLYKKFGDISAHHEEGAKALYFYFTAEHLKEQSISQHP